MGLERYRASVAQRVSVRRGRCSVAVLKPTSRGSAAVATHQSASIVGSDCTGMGSDGLALKHADVPVMHECAPAGNPYARAIVNATHACL